MVSRDAGAHSVNAPRRGPHGFQRVPPERSHDHQWVEGDALLGAPQRAVKGVHPQHGIWGAGIRGVGRHRHGAQPRNEPVARLECAVHNCRVPLGHYRFLWVVIHARFLLFRRSSFRSHSSLNRSEAEIATCLNGHPTAGKALFCVRLVVSGFSTDIT